MVHALPVRSRGAFLFYFRYSGCHRVYATAFVRDVLDEPYLLLIRRITVLDHNMRVVDDPW
jgi:hypothetical protein